MDGPAVYSDSTEDLSNSQYSLYIVANMYLRSYWHIILIFGYLMYWIVKKSYTSYKETQYTKPPIRNAQCLMGNQAGMEMARKRQYEASLEINRKDIELKKERQAREMEEVSKKYAQYNVNRTGGRYLGSASDVPAVPKSAATHHAGNSDSDDNPKKLPKLKGGERDNGSGNSGSQRHDYFKRDCGPRGG
eukprot:Tbor_TRINITY_DN4240_c0_g1::TRINITY_DN4240_c0_g1_i1::g.23871::m.23871